MINRIPWRLMIPSQALYTRYKRTAFEICIWTVEDEKKKKKEKKPVPRKLSRFVSVADVNPSTGKTWRSHDMFSDYSYCHWINTHLSYHLCFVLSFSSSQKLTWVRFLSEFAFFSLLLKMWDNTSRLYHIIKLMYTNEVCSRFHSQTNRSYKFSFIRVTHCSSNYCTIE